MKGAAIKNFKGLKTITLAQNQIDVWGASLELLREKQKKARPLPASLQAATARLSKAKANLEEVVAKAADLQQQVAQVFKDQEEAAAKVAEAEQDRRRRLLHRRRLCTTRYRIEADRDVQIVVTYDAVVNFVAIDSGSYTVSDLGGCNRRRSSQKRSNV